MSTNLSKLRSRQGRTKKDCGDEVATKKQQRGRVTWAQAFRDILIVLVNKGQLITFGLAVVPIIIFARMPALFFPSLSLITIGCS